MLPSSLRTVLLLLLSLAPVSIPVWAQDLHAASLAVIEAASGSSADEVIPTPQQKKEIDLPPLVGRRKPLATRPLGFLSTMAVGVKVDSLGYGIELATPVTRSINLRVGGNLFNYGYTFGVDGVTYNAKILFNSGQVTLDWFPFHGSFHVGPGAMYFNNRVTAKLSAPPGKDFSLGDDTYTNSTTDPMRGNATFAYGRRLAPALVAGFGNVLPKNRHLSVPVDVGVAYMGAAQTTLNLQGTACQSGVCFNMATNPEYQQSLKQEESDLNETLKKFQLYPILSVGLAYRF